LLKCLFWCKSLVIALFNFENLGDEKKTAYTFVWKREYSIIYVREKLLRILIIFCYNMLNSGLNSYYVNCPSI